MNSLQRLAVFTVFALVLFLVGGQVVLAQDTTSKEASSDTKSEVKQESSTETNQARQERRGDRPRGDRQRPRREFDPSRMMERMMERYKEELACSEEEWKAIEPLMKNVAEARMNTRMFGFGWRGGPSSSNPETDALREAVDSEKSSVEDIKAKLKALRDVKKKNEEKLSKAQDELRKVLTVKQEAKMVLIGVLD
jgi:hypothetical protein